MPRSKKFVKIPLFKIRINKNTWANVIGFILFAAASILILSYLQSGETLTTINDYLTSIFGLGGFLFPILIYLFASHFFNSKKLKVIKPNVSLGAVMIFIALVGVSQSGMLGEAIFQNLRQDFSIAGAIIILFSTFIIGLILLLNTSIDSFILFLGSVIRSAYGILQNHVLREFSSKWRNLDKAENKDKDSSGRDFITDKSMPKTAPPLITPTLTNTDQSINIRPVAKSASGPWVYPPVSLLEDVAKKEPDRGDVKKNCDVIEKTLDSFGIRARVAEVNEGPTVTQYALEIVMGTKLSKITGLSNDLALALAARTGQVRIEAPIPGRSLVGIEIPNRKAEIVTLKDLLLSKAFSDDMSVLQVPMGLDVSGQPVITDISDMPHVLIAGTTGAGKSVLLNAWICSFLFRARPEELRLILVDPKRVEFTLYNGIPHLLTEVIVEPKKIISALKWTVSEMENRYKIFATAGQRNLQSYNSQAGLEKIPYIIFVIDELADLMTFAAREAEELITRIAQMARATGIHLILATQRPSVDVITGLMKANIPARVAFNVASMIDSRVVLDLPGAEKLLGRGDMLFLPPDQAKPRRIQGPYIAEREVKKVIDFLIQKSPEVHYTEEVITQDVKVSGRGLITSGGEDEGRDNLFEEAVDILYQEGKGSASLLQRRLSIGYARAARILDQLEAAGYVGPAEGSKPREMLKRTPQSQEQQ